MSDLEGSARLALYHKLKLYKEVGDSVGFNISHEDYDLILGVLEPADERGKPHNTVVYDRVTRCLDGENGSVCMSVLVTVMASVISQAITTEKQLDDAIVLIEQQLRRHFDDALEDEGYVAQGGVRG
jgi:hypothetical protein